MNPIETHSNGVSKSAPPFKPLRSIITCVALTYTLSWAWLAYLISRGGYVALDGIGPLVFMWMPGLCSLLCRHIFREGFRDIGWKWRNWKATLAAIWVPFVVGLPVYLILWGTGLAPRSHNGHAPLHIFGLILAIMVPVGSVFALGEELGWRGYLLDRLIKAGLRRPVFILGLIWAVWHLPVILTGQYTKTDNMALTTIFFVLMILGSNAVICRLWLVSRSIWIPMLIHAVHNTVFQNILQWATVENKWHTMLGGECGALTVLAYGLLAWLMWREPRRKTDGWNGMQQALEEK